MCIDKRLKLALQFTIALRNQNWVCQTGRCEKGKEKGEDRHLFSDLGAFTIEIL